jgi:hypothetical protein
MPIVIIFGILDVVFVVHAAKTGRLNPWAYLIILLPGVGAIAYVLLELIPEWLHGAQGQRAQRRVINTLDPERDYRRMSDDLAISDTIANRITLADECLALKRFEEARRHYEIALSRPMGDEPRYALGKAEAEFGMGLPQGAIATLDKLRERWPGYQSVEGHLLYARSLEESGRTSEALDEYEALVGYSVSTEARMRWATLLARLGRDVEARKIYAEVTTQMRRAPRYVRQAQAEWIGIAERALRA